MPVVGSLEGLEKFAPDRFEDSRLDPRGGLDRGIRHSVLVLRSQGIETCQSCQGGSGHSYLGEWPKFQTETETLPRGACRCDPFQGITVTRSPQPQPP